MMIHDRTGTGETDATRDDSSVGVFHQFLQHLYVQEFRRNNAELDHLNVPVIREGWLGGGNKIGAVSSSELGLCVK